MNILITRQPFPAGLYKIGLFEGPRISKMSKNVLNRNMWNLATAGYICHTLENRVWQHFIVKTIIIAGL